MKDTCLTNKSSGTLLTADIVSHYIEPPETCASWSNFSIKNPLTCKKEALLDCAITRSNASNASLLKEMFHEVRIELTLQKPSGEHVKSRKTSRSGKEILESRSNSIFGRKMSLLLKRCR